ncbi:hypothetical protein MTYP_02862 [Methylophilaceae bacterium]|nr:hypothetical protein MTYP_02862 [Methylophilaceae bacterium]
MNSNAPGQLLGYAIQFSRALYHLLKSGPGDAICVEVLGDVAVTATNGNVTTEEDKSSISGNPLTDRSTDLWKTFSNWKKAINAGALDIEKTKFVLFCNQSGRIGIVNKFSSAQNEQDARKAVDYAKAELKDIKEEHAIWDYYDDLINDDEPLFLKIVEKFDLQIGEGAGLGELFDELRKKHIPENQLDFVLCNLLGFVHKGITEKIAQKKNAIIKWEEFDNQISVLLQRVRCRELIDFTLQNPPMDEDVQYHIKTRPRYLKQLDAIDASDEEVLDAVNDFLRADVNRQKWIENELIDKDVALDFEAKLIKFWKSKRTELEIVNKNLRAEEKGKLLYSRCNSRVETIRDMAPPSSMIPGTYHALADKPIIGWHPNWKQIFVIKKG